MKQILLAVLVAALFLTGCKNEGRTEQGVTVTVTASPAILYLPSRSSNITSAHSDEKTVNVAAVFVFIANDE